jgi:hypothetical protein
MPCMSNLFNILFLELELLVKLLAIIVQFYHIFEDRLQHLSKATLLNNTFHCA